MKPKPLDDAERHLAEVAAKLIAVAEEVGLPDPPDKLGIPLNTIRVLARAYVELRGQVRALHDHVDQTDPNDPVGVALTEVGLERRSAEVEIPRKPQIVPTSKADEQNTKDTDQLVTLYCRVMHVPAVFFNRETYIVRQWDGMDGCWTDCTGEVSREEALRVWADRTDGGTRQVAFAEIDYYRIFPGGTQMKWDGSEGREMLR